MLSKTALRKDLHARGIKTYANAKNEIYIKKEDYHELLERLKGE